jgi:hypothetical protein
VLCGEGVHQTAGYRVHQQLKMSQEVYTDDGELDLGQQEQPLKTTTMKN